MILHVILVFFIWSSSSSSPPPPLLPTAWWRWWLDQERRQERGDTRNGSNHKELWFREYQRLIFISYCLHQIQAAASWRLSNSNSWDRVSQSVSFSRQRYSAPTSSFIISFIHSFIHSSPKMHRVSKIRIVLSPCVRMWISLPNIRIQFRRAHV